MVDKPILICLLLYLALPIATFAIDRDDFDKATQETVRNMMRLEPEIFSSIAAPAKVIDELKKRGCKIPQTDHVSEKTNLISGEFAAKGQKDWAALCSKNSTSSIVVIWGGKARCKAEIARSQDSEWVRFPYETKEYSLYNPWIGNELLSKQGFLRQISVAPVSLIAGSGSPIDDETDYKTINHEAIDDGMSIDAYYTREFYFCIKGKWKKWGARNTD